MIITDATPSTMPMVARLERSLWTLTSFSPSRIIRGRMCSIVPLSDFEAYQRPDQLGPALPGDCYSSCRFLPCPLSRPRCERGHPIQLDLLRRDPTEFRQTSRYSRRS